MYFAILYYTVKFLLSCVNLYFLMYRIRMTSSSEAFVTCIPFPLPPPRLKLWQFMGFLTFSGNIIDKDGNINASSSLIIM